MPNKKANGVVKRGGEYYIPASHVEEMLRAHFDEASVRGGGALDGENANVPVAPWRIFMIMSEFVEGFEFLRQYQKAVTFFGSARCNLSDPVAIEATKLASALAGEGYAIITGGGPGIMAAANKGASDAGGKSVGLNIKLKQEQRTNSFVKESIAFHYFFTRKVMLSFASEMYVFFPGGFGTLDEFFEIVTLVQTEKISRVPVILVGKSYWQPLINWIEMGVYGHYKAIAKGDMEIYHLVDSAQEAMEKIKQLIHKVETPFVGADSGKP
ncbi:MAG: TIGR00730 family Rossman fold protein [bacterium]|nr:TIGR00730 family Rossman fold protein [bacterium]